MVCCAVFLRSALPRHTKREELIAGKHMENHPALELLRSIQSNALSVQSSPKLKLADFAAKPGFGSVYFGPLPCFAWGKPHFAMVQSDRNSESVVLAPITSRKPDALSIKSCLGIPAATLPRRRIGGVASHFQSWVLLPIMLRVPVNHLRDNMSLEARLDDDLQSEAREILKRI